MNFGLLGFGFGKTAADNAVQSMMLNKPPTEKPSKDVKSKSGTGGTPASTVSQNPPADPKMKTQAPSTPGSPTSSATTPGKKKAKKTGPQNPTSTNAKTNAGGNAKTNAKTNAGGNAKTKTPAPKGGGVGAVREAAKELSGLKTLGLAGGALGLGLIGAYGIHQLTKEKDPKYSFLNN